MKQNKDKITNKKECQIHYNDRNYTNLMVQLIYLHAQSGFWRIIVNALYKIYVQHGCVHL